jgi:hypothetical protein
MIYKVWSHDIILLFCAVDVGYHYPVNFCQWPGPKQNYCTTKVDINYKDGYPPCVQHFSVLITVNVYLQIPISMAP